MQIRIRGLLHLQDLPFPWSKHSNTILFRHIRRDQEQSQRICIWDSDNPQKGHSSLAFRIQLATFSPIGDLISEKKINKLVSESPSLKSLTLIEVNFDRWASPYVIEMDALRLPTSFRYQGRASSFPGIVLRNTEEASRCTASTSSFSFKVVHVLDFRDLVPILASVSRFRTTLDFSHLHNYRSLKLCKGDRIKSAPPTMEHVKLRATEYSSFYSDDNFLSNLFWTCRPKLLTLMINQPSDVSASNSTLQSICKWFRKKRRTVHHCKHACKCWRYRLKETKILKRVGNKDEVKAFSRHELSSLTQRESITFILTWD